MVLFLDTEEDVDDVMNATLNDARPTLGSTLADKSWQLYRHFLYQVSYKYADVHKRYEGRPFRVRSWYLCKYLKKATLADVKVAFHSEN